MTSDPFEVTTSVPEKAATAQTNEALATQGAQTSEITTETKVESKTADETATETTVEPDADALEETDTEESVNEDEIETKNESKEKPKKQTGFQRRVNKLNKEIDYWRTEAIKNQKVAAPVNENTETKPQVQLAGKPDKDKFATHDEYIEALAEWKADQKFKSIQEEHRQNSAKDAALKKQNDHFARVETFKDDHDDFDDVWSKLKVPLTLAMSETIKESDLGPDLMYALAKDPKECARIAKLTPLAAARELGKLEVKVSKSQASDPDALVEVKPKTIVKESVVNPVRARGAAVKKDIYDPELPLEDFIKLRNAEERARHAR